MSDRIAGYLIHFDEERRNLTLPPKTGSLAEILRKAPAYFAQAEFDRRSKR